MPAWWRQAQLDAAPLNLLPVLVVKRPKTMAGAEQWAVMDMETLAKIIERLEDAD